MNFGVKVEQKGQSETRNKLQAKIPPVDGVQLIPAMEFGAGNPLDKDAKQDS